MRKILIIFLIAGALLSLAGCGMGERHFVDGSYHVEFADFDSSGYKEYIDVVVEDGSIVSFTADAVDRKGELKSDSKELSDKMKAVVGNYPEKFYRDFANQYLEKEDSEKIDIVAGATLSTRSLMELVVAMEEAASEGTEHFIVVE